MQPPRIVYVDNPAGMASGVKKPLEAAGVAEVSIKEDHHHVRDRYSRLISDKHSMKTAFIGELLGTMLPLLSADLIEGGLLAKYKTAHNMSQQAAVDICSYQFRTWYSSNNGRYATPDRDQLVLDLRQLLYHYESNVDGRRNSCAQTGLLIFSDEVVVLHERTIVNAEKGFLEGMLAAAALLSLFAILFFRNRARAIVQQNPLQGFTQMLLI